MNRARAFLRSTPQDEQIPDGHFYSPVVDPDEVARQAHRVWPAEPRTLGLDYNDAMHKHVLGELFPRLYDAYDYPERDPGAGDTFFTGNTQFGHLDAPTLFVLLRAWKPRRMIEVGSGYSSLLVADVNRRFLGNSLDFTCIEPYPRSFLSDRIDGISRVVEEKVQDVPLETFDALEAGDVLFIDSSHVAKTGSDVNHLFFDVLPRLAAGVRVHLHDIFLPYDYPKDWVINKHRSWNEQYLLRALLMFSRRFRVLFGSSYASHRHRELVTGAVGQFMSGGSFWIERRRSWPLN